jgi:hypothetical protein
MVTMTDVATVASVASVAMMATPVSAVATLRLGRRAEHQSQTQNTTTRNRDADESRHDKVLQGKRFAVFSFGRPTLAIPTSLQSVEGGELLQEIF